MQRKDLPYDARLEGDRMLETIQKMLEVKPYAFNYGKVNLPDILRPFVTPQIRESILSARDAAENAFEGLRRVEDHYRQCYYRLCPIEDLDLFEDHCYSIQRLLSWRADYAEDKTLSPTAKLPSNVLRFHVDEMAYKTYLVEHEKLRLQFLNGPYLRWKVKARDVEEGIKSSGLSPVDQRLCLAWWAGFLDEMRPWETRFDELDLPKWSEMIDVLTVVIEHAVDLKNEWDVVH